MQPAGITLYSIYLGKTATLKYYGRNKYIYAVNPIKTAKIYCAVRSDFTLEPTPIILLIHVALAID